MHPACFPVVPNKLLQCNTCGYYSMLDEHKAAASGIFFPEVPVLAQH